MARPRTGAGVAAQPGCARLADRHASTSVDASPRLTSATTSSSLAGLVDVSEPPGASVRSSLSIWEATVKGIRVLSSGVGDAGEHALQRVAGSGQLIFGDGKGWAEAQAALSA